MRAHLSDEESEELSRQGIDEEKQDILLSSMYAICRKAEKGDMTALTFLLDVSGIRPKNAQTQNAPAGDITLSLVEGARDAP